MNGKDGLIEYSIPQRGSVTKDNAKDLYTITKLLEVWNTFKLTSELIGILLKNDLKKINKIHKIVLEPTTSATYNQKKALNRIIFGRHYSVNTYLKLMEVLIRLKNIQYAKKIEHKINVDNPNPEFFYAEKILPFLWNRLKEIKENNLKNEKALFINDLSAIIQSF